MRRYALRDDQWDCIRDLLPGSPGWVGVTATDNRMFVEAALYRYRAGIPWRGLPERFGDWKTSSAGSAAGQKPVCGRESFSISQQMRTMNTP
jgi:transposase